MKITLADSDLPKVHVHVRAGGCPDAISRFSIATVAEFSGRVPARLKVKGFKKRYLFKRAFRNLLPPRSSRRRSTASVSRWPRG